jgi:hypothetical protein
MPSSDLHAHLMGDARRYDPAENTRSRLVPFRDVLLAFRAKSMSYEQIAATLTRHGLRTSPAGVGAFCRRSITRAEIMRERRRLQKGPPNRPAATAPSSPRLSAVAKPGPVSVPPGRRGRESPGMTTDRLAGQYADSGLPALACLTGRPPARPRGEGG